MAKNPERADQQIELSNYSETMAQKLKASETLNPLIDEVKKINRRIRAIFVPSRIKKALKSHDNNRSFGVYQAYFKSPMFRWFYRSRPAFKRFAQEPLTLACKRLRKFKVFNQENFKLIEHASDKVLKMFVGLGKKDIDFMCQYASTGVFEKVNPKRYLLNHPYKNEWMAIFTLLNDANCLKNAKDVKSLIKLIDPANDIEWLTKFSNSIKLLKQHDCLDSTAINRIKGQADPYLVARQIASFHDMETLGLLSTVPLATYCKTRLTEKPETSLFALLQCRDAKLLPTEENPSPRWMHRVEDFLEHNKDLRVLESLHAAGLLNDPEMDETVDRLTKHVGSVPTLTLEQRKQLITAYCRDELSLDKQLSLMRLLPEQEANIREQFERYFLYEATDRNEIVDGLKSIFGLQGIAYTLSFIYQRVAKAYFLEELPDNDLIQSNQNKNKIGAVETFMNKIAVSLDQFLLGATRPEQLELQGPGLLMEHLREAGLLTDPQLAKFGINLLLDAPKLKVPELKQFNEGQLFPPHVTDEALIYKMLHIENRKYVELFIELKQQGKLTLPLVTSIMSLDDAKKTVLASFIRSPKTKEFWVSNSDNVLAHDHLPELASAINHIVALGLNPVECGELVHYSSKRLTGLMEVLRGLETLTLSQEEMNGLVNESDTLRMNKCIQLVKVSGLLDDDWNKCVKTLMTRNKEDFYAISELVSTFKEYGLPIVYAQQALTHKDIKMIYNIVEMFKVKNITIPIQIVNYLFSDQPKLETLFGRLSELSAAKKSVFGDKFTQGNALDILEKMGHEMKAEHEHHNFSEENKATFFNAFKKRVLPGTRQNKESDDSSSRDSKEAKK